MESFAFLRSLAIFLAMCGPVMASDTIMSQTYTPIPNERLGNKTSRELTVNSLAKCASVCKSDPTCTLWAFQDGTCQIGCPTCQGASVTVDILEAWGSLVKGCWIFLVLSLILSFILLCASLAESLPPPNFNFNGNFPSLF